MTAADGNVTETTENEPDEADVLRCNVTKNLWGCRSGTRRSGTGKSNAGRENNYSILTTKKLDYTIGSGFKALGWRLGVAPYVY